MRLPEVLFVIGFCVTIPMWGATNARFDRGGHADFGHWAMHFTGSDRGVLPVAELDEEGHTSIRYHALYPGVDAVFRGHEDRRECILEIGPEADPETIRFDFGTAPLRADANGNIEIGREQTVMTLKPPTGGGGAWHYVVEPSGTISLRRSPLAVSSILNFATTLGGPGFDAAYAVAVDGSGNIYIAGDTDSQTFSGGGRRQSRDGFVAKLDPAGTQILYLTYFGGSGMDSTRALVVDATGNAYVAGYTTSTDFITTPRAVSSRNAGGEDAFALQLNPAGTMVYATLLGSSGSDQALGIAVDGSGNMYVAGQTTGAFPVTSNALQTLSHGATDCFVVKLNPNSGALIYSTLLGGTGFDSCRGIGVDAAGSAYVAGVTYSSDFPVQTAVQGTLKGFADAFVTKINATGTAVVYSTYLGGDNFDEANAIVVDASGYAYVAGDTTSWNFPVSSFAAQTKAGGEYDAFVTKVSPAGDRLIYATLIGGLGSDTATAISLDGAGHAAIGGFTNSGDLPVRAFVQGAPAGVTDAFSAVVDAFGSSLLFCTYLGGSGDDRAYGIAARPGNVYAVGLTQSADFPGGTAMTGGDTNVFVAQWSGAWPDPPLTLSVTPPAATLSSNQTQQFTAVAITGFNPGVTWSISPGFGTIDTQGFYRAPFSIAAPQTVTVTATSIDGSASVSAIVTVQPPTAQFLKLDSNTQGTWKGAYGADGYNVIGNIAGYPSYVRVTASGNSSYTWAGNTGDLRALQQVVGTQRIAGVWYATDQFIVDLVFNDAQAHQLAVYCVDWDYLGRSQTMDILDGNGTLVDTHTISSFGGGVWLSWNVSGHVQIRVKRTGGANAVLSGLFLGPMVILPVTVSVSPRTTVLAPNQTQALTAVVSNTGNIAVTWLLSPNLGTITSAGLYTSPATITTQQTVTATATSQAEPAVSGSATLTLVSTPNVPSAQFLKLDTTTQGTWKGNYGTEGYNFINGGAGYPAYVNPVSSGASSYTWSSATTDVRALQSISGAQRFAGVWYTADRMVIDMPVNDGQKHQLAVYFLDWDNVGRSQTLEILDANGTVLDTRTIANFSNGIWAVWNIGGHVQLRATRLAGLNAVMTGLFFDPAAKPGPVQFLKTDSITQGSWKGVYGANGYNVINSGVAYPSYVSPTVSGNSSYTWTAVTTDTRAPQQPASTFRTAGVWYAADRFTIDLPFNDSQTHQLAAYCLDWDRAGRTQTVEMLDLNGTALDTRTISDFGGGTWLVWKVTGHVQLRATRLGVGNSVISALMFDTPVP